MQPAAYNVFSTRKTFAIQSIIPFDSFASDTEGETAKIMK